MLVESIILGVAFVFGCFLIGVAIERAGGKIGHVD